MGGKSKGCIETSTRDYIPANFMLYPVPGNSAYDCFQENMQVAKYIAESTLNDYNTDIYIALSPHTQWEGCDYVDYSGDSIDKIEAAPENIARIVSNPIAFGTFNAAFATITMHCTYEHKSQNYKIEYKYYIVDFYNYEKYVVLLEEEALGIARSYELFGSCPGLYQWKKGHKGYKIFL